MESMDENDRQETDSTSEKIDEREDFEYEEMVSLYDESMRHLSEGQIVTGRVIAINPNHVVVDVGYKSEGLIPIAEFVDYEGNLSVEIGDDVEVLLERTEDAEGHVLLSKQKAERMMVWSDIEKSYKAGDIIRGRVIDRIKGGLTVDVGIRAFLPGSLVDIKPVKNLESLRGQELEFKVISMDRRRNNVVLSRKAVLEKEFAAKKAETLTLLEEGVILEGVVKNITDYGVFVDLGGIDGLLHITDISWGRVNHPSEHFAIGDEAEVVVLKFDPDTERVSLGYKQRSEDPWSLVDKKYPLGSKVRGKVVSLVDYGAFVELEEGVEGLIHVSEMSWTKKVVNPAKILEVGDEVEAIVSELDLPQRRISLSLRQAERNPWEELAISHPVGSVIEGKVRNLTEFGAFVQITDEIDGLIHVSDMSWTKRIKHPGDVLNKGDDLRARITNIDVENQRVSLSIKEFLPNEWDSFVEESTVGDTVTGRVVNVTDFGLFVDIYEGLEGLAHVSEIESGTSSLEDQYSVGEWVSARILRIEQEDKKVGLTMRGVPQPTADEIAELEAAHAEEEAEEPAAGEELSAVETEDSDEPSEEEVDVEAELTEAEGEGEAVAEAEATVVEEVAEVADEKAELNAEEEAEATDESAEEQSEAEVVEVEEETLEETAAVEEAKESAAPAEEPEAPEIDNSTEETEEELDADKAKETVD
ncbi:MAG: 30S ribosomal protein S1 [Thermoanaerobaculia bacterium]|jgi:small subunit ribosomal protein S1